MTIFRMFSFCFVIHSFQSLLHVFASTGLAATRGGARGMNPRAAQSEPSARAPQITPAIPSEPPVFSHGTPPIQAMLESQILKFCSENRTHPCKRPCPAARLFDGPPGN